MAEGQYRFERLTPTDDVDLSIYENAIDYVFDNTDIRNVAISGAYSAGKSSVLASYKKKHRNLRFLHISLAHFVSLDKEDEQDVKESVLEGKILNQLIHQIKLLLVLLKQPNIQVIPCISLMFPNYLS